MVFSMRKKFETEEERKIETEEKRVGKTIFFEKGVSESVSLVMKSSLSLSLPPLSSFLLSSSFFWNRKLGQKKKQKKLFFLFFFSLFAKGKSFPINEFKGRKNGEKEEARKRKKERKKIFDDER